MEEIIETPDTSSQSCSEENTTMSPIIASSFGEESEADDSIVKKTMNENFNIIESDSDEEVFHDILSSTKIEPYSSTDGTDASTENKNSTQGKKELQYRKYSSINSEDSNLSQVNTNNIQGMEKQYRELDHSESESDIIVLSDEEQSNNSTVNESPSLSKDQQGKKYDIVIADNQIKVTTNDFKMQEEKIGNLQGKFEKIDLTKNSHSVVEIDAKDQSTKVTKQQYQTQKEKVDKINIDLQRAKNLLRTMNLNTLPDKGAALDARVQSLTKSAKEESDKLNNMRVEEGDKTTVLKPIIWENLEAGLAGVQSRTTGKQALQTLHMQKALTLEGLEELHGSLKTRPTEDTYAADPEGLKVELMQHQKHALAWLSWRETQKPSGGILADDMGLGKTLTMISLILKTIQESDDENQESISRSSKYKGGTLVVCPASLINQWAAEIKKHVKKYLLAVNLYHGTTRETKAKRLAQQDIVITTYGLVMSDNNKSGPLFGVKWQRVILDEAHQVRNHKAQTSVSVCNLSAKSRWILTGTPVHNKELDLYALLKFLRCSPFDDLAVWKRWVANKTGGGQDRLHLIISSLILRRTKQQLIERKMLNSMPDKAWEIVPIKLDEPEMNVYQKVLIFSRTLFAQFLHQRAEKDSDNCADQIQMNPNSEYFKMHQRLVKLNKVKKIKQHEILVLLLRLRQICCHPSLINSMLQRDEDVDSSETEESEEMNLLEQLNKLSLNDNHDDQNHEDHHDPAAGLSAEPEGVGLAQASRNWFNLSNPVLAEDRISSKIRAIINTIQNVPGGDKVIVVSQWTKFLGLMSLQLKKLKIAFYQLDGSVPVPKRMDIVNNINDPKNNVKILLLSLTAGGVGLNLIGANHLILTDLHWNPQLEMQAQDRIYRVGQTKAVKIYKLMAVDTIEERIKQLQEKKLNIAHEVLTGAKVEQKLSLDDLKMLFNFK